MRRPSWLHAALILALLTVLGTRAVNHLNGAKIKTVDGNVIFMAARQGGDIKFKDTHTAIFGNLTVQEVLDRAKEYGKVLDGKLEEARKNKEEVTTLAQKLDRVLGKSGRNRRSAEKPPPLSVGPTRSTDSVPGAPGPDPARKARSVPGAPEGDPARKAHSVPGAPGPDPARKARSAPGASEADPVRKARSALGAPEAEPARKARSVPGAPEAEPGSPEVYPDYPRPYPEDIPDTSYPDEYYSDPLPERDHDTYGYRYGPAAEAEYDGDMYGPAAEAEPDHNTHDTYRYRYGPRVESEYNEDFPDYMGPAYDSPHDDRPYEYRPDDYRPDDGLPDDDRPDDDTDFENMTGRYGNRYPGDPLRVDWDPADPFPEHAPESAPHPQGDGSGEFPAPEPLDWGPPADPEGVPYPEPEHFPPFPKPEDFPPFPEPEDFSPFPHDPAWDPEPEQPAGPEREIPAGGPEQQPRPDPQDWAPPGRYPRSFPGFRPRISQRDQRPLLEHPDWAPSGEPEPLPPYGPGNPHDVPGNPPMEAGIPANLPMKPEPYPDFPAPKVPNNNTNTGKLADSPHPDLSRAERSLPGGTKHEARRLADLPPQGDPEPRPEADPRAPNPGEAGGATGEAGPPVLERMRHGKAPRTRGNKGMAAKLY